MFQVIKVENGWLSVQGQVQFFSTQHAAKEHAQRHNEWNAQERKKAKDAGLEKAKGAADFENRKSWKITDVAIPKNHEYRGVYGQ